MDELGLILHKQQSKGLTSILVIQHPKNVPCVDGWKLGYSHPLPWMVCDIPWAPTIHTSVDTPLDSSMCSWVRSIHHGTSNQSMGITSILAIKHSKDGLALIKTGTPLALTLVSVWCTMSSNHPYMCFGIPLNTSVGVWLRLVHHCTLHKQPGNGIISILAIQYYTDGHA